MGQMALKRRNFCYLIVWTTVSSVIVKIEFFPEWMANISLLEHFYVNKFVPFVLSH